MGLRFRKSINIGGFRINFSKSGVGYSYGTKGFRVTHGANGRNYKTVNLGNGISYREPCSTKNSSPDDVDFKDTKGYKALIFMLKFMATGGLYMYYAMYKYFKNKIKPRPIPKENQNDTIEFPPGVYIYPHNPKKD